ncbi:Crp/Fnr family transcriptional regulator [Clostridium sp. chh4-2]|uniref:Crp/Fnr family transcriptional regulator n=1 Tax=Clostridium sp. chh4-2 TaxID=2067550 RepID=UPI000CCEDAA2|nr:Crp/Fnr family transcriptional regulator [Clostridium sp. chh4-2]PNV63282.1 Crp/Fnr family transcriptional regulator [Clostridium sp. chh4-2]
MTLEELTVKYPKVEPYIRNMPEEIKKRYTIKKFPPGHIIHQKHFALDYFGIVCNGDHRVINEFENGNVFMIEKNEPIDFVGEVTILAGMAETSVTIETITECTILMISRKDFESWIEQDIHFLRLVAQKVAFKLYRSSYTNGAKLFYPPNFLLLDYLLKYAKEKGIEGEKQVVVTKTRQELNEELGMTVKTINRTIGKLKEDGLVSMRKGKMVMDLEQYERGKKEIVYYVK